MRKIKGEFRVLLNFMPKEEWQSQILSKLNLRPLAFDDLARNFGFEKDSPEYKDLIALVSSLQEKHKSVEPQIKAAFVEGAYVFPLYRTDQEEELVKQGILSEKEHKFNLKTVAREFGIEPDQTFSFIFGRER